MSEVPTMLANLAPIPDSDFSEFGAIEVRSVSRIQRLVGSFLGRNWVTIPHVTHHDEIDVTATEARRTDCNAAHPGAKVTPVALLVLAMAPALAVQPIFNTRSERTARASSRSIISLSAWRWIRPAGCSCR